MVLLFSGQALLLHASKNQPANQGQTNDILQNAANMGIKMETASVFLRTSTKLLSKLKADKKAETEDAMLDMAPLSWDGKEKENTYIIKVEDSEGQYRPLFKQFDDVPKISYKETGSPFDVGVVLVKQSDNKSTKKKSVGGALRGGYCESCDHWYRCSLREHLSSNKHKEFVSKLENFKNLEAVSNDLPSFSQFLKHNKGKLLVDSSQNLASAINSNDTNNNINGQSEAVVDKRLDQPGSDKGSLNILAGKSLSSENLVKQTGVTENPTKFLIQNYKLDCAFSEVMDLTESVNSARNTDEETTSQNCIETKPALHADFHSSTILHLVRNVNRDSSGQEIDNAINSESNHDSRVEMAKIQSQSFKTEKTDTCNFQEASFEVPSNGKTVTPEANFSSSCSFGDSGIRNALSVLQTNISESSHSSHRRHSADIFCESINRIVQRQGNALEDVIENSKISVESVISGDNKNFLHTPTFDTFLKEKNNEVKDSFCMPVLFPVEQLSETDIENGIMPVIDKHTPPSHNQIENLNALGSAALENINDSTQGELILKNGPVNELCKTSSKDSVKSLNDSNKTEVMDFETVLHTPKGKLGSKLAEQINDKVKNSGSTITSVRNWLLPNEDKENVCSDLSVAKMNDTLIAPDVCVTKEKELEQLTDCEQKQQTLVANWIQTQEFGTSSENHVTTIAETEMEVFHNLETPCKESELKDNLSSRDITTPISEMYNDQFTDLSSIPTDSVISDNEYAPILEHFNETKYDKSEKMKDNSDVIDAADSSNKETAICDDNYVPNECNHEVKFGSFQSSLELNGTHSKHLTNSEGINPTFNMNNCSINTAEENACIQLKEKLATYPSSDSGNKPECVKSVKENCSVDNLSFSENSYLNNVTQHDKELCIMADKISSDKTKSETIESKGAKGKKKAVKPKVREAKTIKGKSNNSVEKCHTPVSNISCDSATALHNSASGSFNTVNSHFIQQQAYSPISQSSDHFIQQQHNSQSYCMNGAQSCNQTYQYNQQFYGQNVGSQVHYDQGQSYYNTGLLPGHNFYSEERHAFYQNHHSMQSQHYGFSGLTDCNNFAVQSPQQFANNVLSYPQGSYSGAQINGNIHMNSVNINHNCVQNFEDFSQIDFLDKSGFSPNASQSGSCVSSPGPFYPTQNLPIPNVQTVPVHVSSHSSQQFSQEFSPLQNNYHVPSQVNQQYSQQCYPDNQQNSSHFSQFSQSYHSPVSQHFSPVSQVIQEPSQGNQLYLSSSGYASQNMSQVSKTSGRTFETISLNDIAEENCSSSQMSFSFGRIKTTENQNFGNIDNNLNRKPAVSKKGRRKMVTEGQMNRNNLDDKSSCHSQTTLYMNTSTSGHAVSNPVVNEMPSSVQPLKPSFSMATDHQQQTNYQRLNHEENTSSDKSYTSAKVGDTKIKISKVANSAGGKKTDLKDYWNVKKTGDCRLVFRAHKRKADDEWSVGNAGFTPDPENSVTEQRYGGLHEAKRRRCLVNVY